MKLKTYINGTEYDIVDGVTFSEEYNETLDSASIIIDQVPKIDDLKPYDDVFIYDDSSEFLGYRSSFTKIVGIKNETHEGSNEIEIDEELFDILSLPSNQIKSSKARLDYSSGDYTGIWSDVDFRLVGSTIEIQVRPIHASPIWVSLHKVGNKYYFDYSDPNVNYDYAMFEFIQFEVQNSNISKPTFYRHYLVDQYTEERLNPIVNLYKYKIELFSETKRLETIQLPNKSITQPFNIAKKKSVADVVEQIVELYSPVIKVAINDEEWVYRRKYYCDPKLRQVFGEDFQKCYSPDFSMDNPSLRDVLNQLFLTKDCIVLVKDDMITFLDISKRTDTFSTNGCAQIVSSMSSENYSDNLKRTYSNALSDESSTRRVEYLGFRNSDDPLMTLENMRLETRYGIHKINRVLMCYYKKAVILDKDNLQPTRYVVFLCKQDITKLVLLEEQRNTLSKDWDDFTNNIPSGANVIDEMAQYKLCTVGYSIGSNVISGWGTKYTYPEGWWQTLLGQSTTKTYLENIFRLIDENLPYGIYNYGYIGKDLPDNEVASVTQSGNPMDYLVSVYTGAKKLKSFFFEVDYDGFYNGTIVHSKDVERDEVTINDNSNTSLVLLEKDGLFQKEKINRFGNSSIVINAVYDDVSGLQKLGSVYDDDVIIYHREYQIWHNLVKATYYGTKDYVLKNYYTSVYAKNRPFSLASYSESVLRCENKKMYLLFSKDAQYYEKFNGYYNQNKTFTFSNFYGNTFIEKLLSFCVPDNEAVSIGKFISYDKINEGLISVNGSDYFRADIIEFVSGYSLCMNISMVDNMSMGVYIKTPNPTFNPNILNSESDLYDKNGEDIVTGSVQDFYSVVDNETGEIDTMQFIFGHKDDDYSEDDLIDYISGIESYFYDKLNILPKVPSILSTKNVIKYEGNIHKDNKEIIDMTFQFEPYTKEDDILISPWVMKLSNLNGKYLKIDKTYTKVDSASYNYQLNVICATGFQDDGHTKYYPTIVVQVPISDMSNFTTTLNCNFGFNWSESMYDLEDLFVDETIVGYEVRLQELVSCDETKMVFNGTIIETVKNNMFSDAYPKTPEEKTIILHRVTQVFGNNFSSDTINYYYSNIEMINLDNGLKFRNFTDSGMIYGQMATSKRNMLYYDAFNSDNSYDETLRLATGISKTYYKNMFLQISGDYMKKEIVYDQYPEGTSDITFEDERVSDFITIERDTPNDIQLEVSNYIKVDLSYLSSESARSIRMWYCDRKDHSVQNSGVLNFVFGVNLTSDDYQRGYVKIPISALTRKNPNVYGVNNLIVGKSNNFLSSENDKMYGNGQYYVVE